MGSAKHVDPIFVGKHRIIRKVILTVRGWETAWTW